MSKRNQLDNLVPKFVTWRREALNHPEQADLCYANLRFSNLSDLDLSEADLRSADLTGANLENANLIGADLTNADLRGANLHTAHLGNANLSHALLSHANLSYAHLHNANLSDAKLNSERLRDRTNLKGADLSDANLSDADLYYANLRGAVLNGSNVAKAKLAYAELTNALYAPASDPPASYVAGIAGLETLHLVPSDKSGLVALRKLLQDAGLRQDERSATYSIERSVTKDQLATFPSINGTWIAGVGRRIGFDWTTAYGLYPARALIMIVALGLFLTPVYMRAMLYPTEASGIVQVFPADRLDGTAGNGADEKERKKVVVEAKNWIAAFPPAAYFSLISAVNIGFEQFTPGDWIRRLQDREYTLEAVGWVRVVAGIQSVLSVYLLAIWALTQFGRPFD